MPTTGLQLPQEPPNQAAMAQFHLVLEEAELLSEEVVHHSAEVEHLSAAVVLLLEELDLLSEEPVLLMALQSLDSEGLELLVLLQAQH